MTTHLQDGEAVVLPDFKGVDHLYVQKKLANGAPDFKGTVPTKVDKCLREGRCGACGLLIPGDSLYFIVEETSIRGRAAPFETSGGMDIRLYEPPLHRICARLAGRLCPVLRKQERGRAGIAKVPKGGVGKVPRRGGFGGWHFPKRIDAYDLIPIRAGPATQDVTGGRPEATYPAYTTDTPGASPP